MSLSLARLQEILREDAEFRSQQREDAARHEHQYRLLLDAVNNVWIQHGVLEGSPQRKTWESKTDRGRFYHRTIPESLLQTPLSEPQMTLVQYKSLPRPIQAKVPQYQHLPPDSPEVVEIPISYLEPQDLTERGVEASAAASTQQSHVLASHRHTIKGNLTNKLSEYARGIAGQARPFTPGGLGQQSNASSSEILDAEARAAVERSKRVLEIGSKAAWAEGNLLLTAPPGVAVDFQVGLTWNDVYAEETSTMKNLAGELDPGGLQHEFSPDEDDRMYQDSSNVTTYTQRPRSTPLFSKAYFDDDSLFGSSSSSSSDDESSDDGFSEGDLVAIKNASAASAVLDTVRHITEHVEEISIDSQEVDNLLIDLTLTDYPQHSSGLKKAIPTNPLELARRRAKDENDAARKSWASTQLLPIRDFDALIPNPALDYPFTLDDFQQQAIARLERSESVFVAAHTSAGKTVVAEYAVALSKQRGTRCVYTSPIKALSNQKFRDFSLKFGSENVGLVTGDLQVNVDDSTCLIMTTEILRSMLYRGADLIRDIEWVIFDEVHYVNDTERGVVWEEVIIMLPSYVNLIFLSATTPNTLEFSDWIGRTKRKPVHVIKTDYRPVPLSHHLWAGNKLHKVMEGKGGFMESGYKEASDALIPASVKEAMKKGGPKAKPPPRPLTGSKQLAWQAQGSKANWVSLIRYLERELLMPTVVFSFSKRKCVEIAYMLQSLDLNTAKERSAVQAFTHQTVARLSPADSQLPQVQMICEMVQRGIGVHHGGLLPILKEAVEILFSRNLIKVLFATETFAMGVNMPARSVVFNSIRKHDGTQFRVLEPGEYTQMAGRAGRRGLDKVGTVVLCCFGEEPPPLPILKQMLTGSSTRLQSQFRLTYNMILNLLRVEEMSVESMISRSFSEFATQRALTNNDYPQLLSRGLRTLSKLDVAFENEAPNRVGAEDLEQYFTVTREVMHMYTDVLSYIHQTESAAFGDLLQPGRLILVSAARKLGCVRAPAIVIRSETGASVQSMSLKGGGTQDPATCKLTCLVLLPPSFVLREQNVKYPKGSVGYVGSSGVRVYSIREVSVEDILLVTSRKHKIDPRSILAELPAAQGRDQSLRGSQLNGNDPFAGLMALGRKSKDDNAMREAVSSHSDQKVDCVVELLTAAEKEELQESGLPLQDLKAYLKRGSDVMVYRKHCDQLEDLIVQLRSFSSHRHPSLERFFSDLERKETLRDKVETLRHLLSSESLQLFPDFLQRKSVLQKLGYIDSNEAVCVKGRVACEVNTCEELIATELVFEGLLNNLQPEEIAAVLSPLVFQGKRGEDDFDVELPGNLVSCCKQMKRIARNLGHLQKEQGLNVDPEDYSESTMNFGLVHVVYEWALGVPFKTICDLTEVEEGSIVRCITRLDELCREVRNCARVVGNPTLYRKLEAASTAIKRDIVFAASLYVS